MPKSILVAEVGINHNGDIDIAKKLIDAAVLGGCQYVKFQKRTVEKVYTKEELDKYRESPWGTTNREQKNGLEFNKNQYDIIDAYCREKKIEWFASPWDVDSVDFLMQYNIPFIKLASALNTNLELINKIKDTKKSVIISTGMSSKKEIDTLIDILGDQIKYILSCTSVYPSISEIMNMNRIKTLQNILKDTTFKVGFSNHSPGIIHIIQAATMGCEMIEFHITLDRSMYGSDQASAIEIQGVFKIKDYINAIEKSWGNGKIEILDEEIPFMKKLRKT